MIGRGRRTHVFKHTEDGESAWVVVFWPDPFDMYWIERDTWEKAFTRALELERQRMGGY